MGFVLGLIISMMLIVCLVLEMCAAVRPIFSIFLLGGVIALGVALFFAGILLTPLFIFGFLINIPIVIAAAIAGGKDAR